MSLAEIAGSRRHDGAFGEHQSAARLDGQPYVFFANEIERGGTV
jgi:hypothetical protein